MAIRKAGDILNGDTSTQAIARKAIEDAGEMFSPQAAQEVASHHVFLDEGKVGHINDNDPTSTIYR